MLPVFYAREREGLEPMQSITDLQKVLRPVFERHYTEKVYLTNLHNNNMNFYVVGCTRALLPVLQNEISGTLHGADSVTLNHVESEMLIDGGIRENGILLYDSKC